MLEYIKLENLTQLLSNHPVWCAISAIIFVLLVFLLLKYNVLNHAKKFRKLAFFAIIGIAAGYIYLEKPYVEISGDNLSFNLPDFQNCVVTFENTLNFKSYEIRNLQYTNESYTISDVGHLVPIQSKDSFLKIKNPYPRNHSTNSNYVYNVSVDFDPIVNGKIISIVLDNNSLTNETFVSSNLVSTGSLVKVRHMRNLLETLILNFNDTISNWLITILVIICCALFTEVVGMELNEYILPEKYLKKRLFKEVKINESETQKYAEAFDKYAKNWQLRSVRFRFLQALGPALGFILTVSSLIAALDPNVLANDPSAFLKGIHIAMISTFVGLGLRLLALEASRLNDVFLDAAERFLLP